MKKIFYLFLILLIIFIIGCNKEEIKAEPEITAKVVEEIETEEIVEEEDIETVRLCHDTDNGIVRWINGSIFGFNNKAERFEHNDYCFDNNILVEYYCENETPQNRTFLCKNGCEDNHCL